MATSSSSAPTGGASVTEGKATIYFPSAKGVFYNPPQIPNRDLSVLALRHFARQWQKEAVEKAAQQQAKAAARAAAAAAKSGGAAPAAGEAQSEPAASAEAAAPAEPFVPPRIRVLDAMTASGLRALRYTLEVPEVASVVANDLDATALAALRENVRRNGLSEDVVVPSMGDAVSVMAASKPPTGQQFEAVELDPYGTAAPFLDSAVQCVAEGGMLMVTCTDLAVLCATYPEKCHAIYGAYPLKAKYCHEAALRIVLGCIESHANRHRRYIVPQLCVHINFYVRLFVRVYTSPGEVKKSPTKLSHVYQCVGCDTYTMQPVARIVERNGHEKIVAGQGPPVDRQCEHCGRVHHVGGPLWSAPMHDEKFVRGLLDSLQEGEGQELASSRRLIGMLTSVMEELPDVPLFHQLNHMCSVLHVTTPTLLAAVSALMRQGYRVSRSHTDASAIKTDAPNSALWDVLRCWAKTQTQFQSKKGGMSETAPGTRIMATPPAVEADFTPTKEATALLSKKSEDGVKLSRFLPNPDEWGPGSRGTSHAQFAPADNGQAGEGAADDASAPAAAEVRGAYGANGASMLDKRARLQNKRAKKRQALAAADGATATPGDEGEEGGGEGAGEQ